MNNSEFISYIDEAIRQEMLLGGARNEYKLTGLRNIKSDFNYITSKDKKSDTIDILKKLRKEREENVDLYLSQNRRDLWLQEHTELVLLNTYLPEEPSEQEVVSFLETLSDISKTKSSFKKFQDACTKQFGMKVDSQIILDFIGK